MVPCWCCKAPVSDGDVYCWTCRHSPGCSRCSVSRQPVGEPSKAARPALPRKHKEWWLR